MRYKFGFKKISLIALLLALPVFYLSASEPEPEPLIVGRDIALEQKLDAAFTEIIQKNLTDATIDLSAFYNKKLKKICAQLMQENETQFESRVGENVESYNDETRAHYSFKGRIFWFFFEDAPPSQILLKSTFLEHGFLYFPPDDLGAPKNCYNSAIMKLKRYDSREYEPYYSYYFVGDGK